MISTDGISIIVPIFKAEQFLPKCLDSILAQTYTNFELILVNDGSPDRSGQICDAYAAMDRRIKLIHTKNKGASSSRNTGLATATQRYIGWVDADDWIEPDMFETLHKYAIAYDSDITECAYVEHSKNLLIRSRPVEEIASGNGHYILHQFFTAQMKPSLWNKLYKREVIVSCLFPPARIHQDFYVNLSLALKMHSYVRIPDVKYHYEVRNDSITTTFTGRQIREAIYLYDHEMSLAYNKNYEKIAIRYLKKDAINRMIGRFFSISQNAEIPKQTIYNIIIRKRLGFKLYQYLLMSKIHIKTKISYFLILYNMRSLQAILHQKLGKE